MRVFVRILLISLLAASLDAQDAAWSVGLSFKLVLNDQGETPIANRYVTEEQIRHVVEATNEIYARSGVNWRFELDEILELSGLEQYHSTPTHLETAHRDLELIAKSEPERFAWREDAINIYVVDEFAFAGACSFPSNGEIVMLQSRQASSVHEDRLLAHELGHFFSLLHPFSCLGQESSCSQESRRCRSSGAWHSSETAIVECSDVCVSYEANVMNYADRPLDEFEFSACQIREMSFELFDPVGSRGQLLRWNREESPSDATFLRGDSNSDGQLDVSDAVHLLAFLFLGEANIHCADGADVDDSGKLDLSDAIVALGVLFLGRTLDGWGECRADASEDSLSLCEISACWN